jgi:geranylgeranyl diphosphate synthase type II
MEFSEYINQYKDAIYSKIMEYLPVKDPEEHYRIVREYSERRGKYVRPGLLMLTGEMFGATMDKLALPAAAMQLSEDWILVHDDIEDNSELRRGKPALHRIYGTEIAINAGDAMHIAMWRMLKDYMLKMGNDLGNAVYEKFYDMLEYTVEGQYMETNFIYNIKNLSKVPEDFYFRIVNGKTCYYSVYGPMQIGAIIGGKDPGTVNIMKSIGEPAGMAFQITDDILDMTGDEKDFGKKRYGDLYEGKLTLIMAHSYSSATSEEKAKIDAVYAKKREQKTQEDIGFLVKIVEKYKGIEYARSVAEDYAKKARETVETYRGVIPDNEYSKTMLSAVEALYNRKK